ncbi:uncharacterized protein LOC129601103, partial [Paramacrobiotus metropolitanus]|uniref:uncharacterized protein LOC129601103 n=1 Tax=Paramacrobiotus metropolitanus TaxID=2943436 RepID=UPI0024460DF3
MSALTREADRPSDSGNCALPDAWNGEWFLSGVVGVININQNSITGKGECVLQKSDKFIHKFLLYNRVQNCSQCIITSSPQQHPNVIQFKESYCVPSEEQYSFEELCDTITGNADLFTMFRLNAEPERCPFNGRYSFTYTQGYTECSNPVSQTETCVKDSEMMLHYKSCPDATEERNVKLECLGSWRNGENWYLIGRITHTMANSNEEIFRCFMYKMTDSGVQLAQSADATCNALYSPQEGPQTLTLTPENDPEPNCVFPLWLSERRSWHAMESDVQFRFAAS